MKKVILFLVVIFPLLASAQVQGVKISELPQADFPLSGSILPIVQNGTTKKAPVDSLLRTTSVDNTMTYDPLTVTIGVDTTHTDTTATTGFNVKQNFIPFSNGLKIRGSTLRSFNGLGDSTTIGSLGSGWNLTGNASIDTSVNFMGTTDDKDVLFKRNSLYSGLISLYNTSFGRESGVNIRLGAGTLNTSIGTGSLKNNSSGNSNTAIGSNALTLLTNGSGNTAVGSGAMILTTTGANNTALGTDALNRSNAGNYNIAVGFQSLMPTAGTLGNSNIGIGPLAGGRSNSGTRNNIIIGNNTGGLNNANNIPGASNIIIGDSIACQTNGGNNLINIGNLIFGTDVDGRNTTVSTGNIGIGTISPSTRLQVNGTTQATQFMVSALNSAPSSATDTGTTGEIRITATYIYICTATNTWVRAALSTW
ncbi:MAG: hypothetical protein QM791_23775 [Ferruginibacter sp.]